jgi:hypothetical protein
MKFSALSFVFASILAKVAPSLGYTAEELKERHPDLTSDRVGNAAILCPFVRMLERSGALDDLDNLSDDGGLVFDARDLYAPVNEFGLECDLATLVPWGTGLGQEQTVTGPADILFAILNPFKTVEPDLERLFEVDAPSLGNPTECGLNFEGNGASGWSETRYSQTISKLEAKADADGHLSYEDLLNTKIETCEELGMEPFDGDMKLMYNYLGGLDRGYIDITDVANFIKESPEMPSVKAIAQINYFARNNPVFDVPGATP